jgi:hypothetical protein
MSVGRSEFECALCIRDKINTERLRGVTHAQVIGNSENFVGSALVEYSIAPPLIEETAKESRAHRAVLQSRGKRVPRIKRSALRDELVILPGAAMSAADVVRALKAYIAEVTRNGMYIGYYEGRLMIERVDGTLEEAGQ